MKPEVYALFLFWSMETRLLLASHANASPPLPLGATTSPRTSGVRTTLGRIRLLPRSFHSWLHCSAHPDSLDVRSYTLITKPLPLLCVGLASSMEGQNQKRDYQIGKPQQGLTSVWTNTTFVVLLGNRSTARVSHIDSYGTPQPEQKYICTPTHWHLSGAWHENSVRCAPEMCSSGPCCRSCFGAM
jgi:hypothetical protein